MNFKYDVETLLQAILFNTVEVLPGQIEELRKEVEVLVENANLSGEPIRHYIGYEISGILHFGNNTYQMLKVAKLQQAGVQCIIWLADYHTKINKKLDGKMSTINKVAHEYFEPVFRKTIDNCGGDSSKLVVLYALDEYFRKNKDGLSFWDFEFEVEEHLTVNRVLRSLSIAGKEAGSESDYKLTRYPGMQAADVFWHQTHLVQSGLDQRKIYVSCRDMAEKLGPEFQLKIGSQTVKPITMFTKLLLGMLPPQTSTNTNGSTDEAVSKMSKSRPDSAIFEHDSLEEIQRKLRKAYCPIPIYYKPNSNEPITLTEASKSSDLPTFRHTQKGSYEAKLKEMDEMTKNPLLNWCENLIYPAGKTISVTRPEKFGGDKTYNSFDEIQKDYLEGNLHPLDLKNAVAVTLADWFTPIREWVEKNPEGIELIQNAKMKK